jgi:hypothetical protein
LPQVIRFAADHASTRRKRRESWRFGSTGRNGADSVHKAFDVPFWDAAVRDRYVPLVPAVQPRPVSQVPSPLSRGRRDVDDAAIPSGARPKATKNGENASANNGDANSDDASNGGANRPIAEHSHVRLLRFLTEPALQPASLRSVAESRSQESLQQERPQQWSDAWQASRRSHLYHS